MCLRMSVCDTSDYVVAFDRFRRLPTDLLLTYARDLVGRLSPHEGVHTVRFLDVGAGIGQFAEAVAMAVEETGRAFALTMLEPSAAFRSFLWARSIGARGQVIASTLEEYQSDVAFDLILLSEVAHLFTNRSRAFDRLRDLLARGGVLGLRYGSNEQVRDRPWYRYFPEVHRLDLERQPAAVDYERVLERRGFVTETIQVNEPWELGPDELVDFMRSRPFSGFRLVDDRLLQPRIDAFADAVRAGDVDTFWHNRMTWTIARWANT
ncbi:MAG TPA: methyltransferase [Herpetosiphonaceae bacterium]|nr:methyltransferase [Herpetosiphonaceae bacterium]